MNRIALSLLVLTGTFASSLQAQAIPGQSLAGPTPSLETGSADNGPEIDLTTVQAEKKDEKDGNWHSSLNLGTSFATGNIDRRAASLNAEATREDDSGRTMLKATWNYSQQKRAQNENFPVSNTNPSRWMVDQRRTTGEARHDLFISDDKRTYAFGHVEAQNDKNQQIDLRLAATIGVGHQVVKTKDLTWGIEAGVGYFIEKSRQAIVPDSEHPVGKIGSELDWKFHEDWRFLHSARLYLSLEDADDAYGISDARLRTKFGESTFGQIQWILQWDNTPGINNFGGRLERVDHLFLLTVGWTF